MEIFQAYVVQRFYLVCRLNKDQANVLIDGDYTARIVDFGSASVAGDVPEALAYLQSTAREPCAIRWAAPEHFLGGTERTTKIDIYSLGNLISLASPPPIPRAPTSSFSGIVGPIPVV